MNEAIKRTEYLDRLCAFRDKQVIKVVTGVRRCGKSTLLSMFRGLLRADGVSDEQIVSVNLEDFDHFELRDPARLHAFLKERLIPDKTVYIFLDEIQLCERFPEVVDSLYIREHVDLYITGSNATLLSGNLATLISGRYIEISMLPLSFSEYTGARKKRDSLNRLYTSYLEESSFPYALAFNGNRQEIRQYLDGIYNTVLVKDISARYKFPDTMMLESVARFVLENIGRPLSTKKIADTMTSAGRKIDVKTVEKYLDALIKSYIVYKAKRYDIKGKQHLKTLDKYYAVDIGLRYYLLGSRSTDVGRMLENVIYLELCRRGYEVYVGKMDNFEVDFVAMENDRPVYIQAASTVRDESTLERELRPLKLIRDNFTKLILTLDDDPEADYDGIRRINALDWLLNGDPAKNL